MKITLLFLILMGVVLLWLLPVNRVMAADITVTTSNPYVNADGACSLVEAIENANNDAQTHADCPAGAGADVITLTQTINVDGSTLFLASANLGNVGLPEITSDITITGAQIRRTGGTQFRFFSVPASGALTLEDMTIRGGRAVGECTTFGTGSNSGCGGAIIVTGGDLTLSDVTLVDNQALESVAGDFPRGGAIALLGGELTATESTFSSNHADLAGGAIYGQYNTTEMSITDSTFSDNTAATLGGAIVSLTSSDLEIFGSTFTNNQVTSATGGNDGGGAIFNAGSSQLAVVNSTFTGNSAENGGAININNAADAFISNSTFTGNSATAGGAIVNQGSGATVNLYSSTVTNNTATTGAGISNGRLGSQSGIANIFNSTISNNDASNDGGGIWSIGTLNIETSVIDNNTGSDGAGIFVGSLGGGNAVSIFGTNVINNDASGEGGGLYYTEDPSGAGNTLSVDTSTFDNNRADAGGGLFVEGTTTTISNSTISNNTAVGGVSAGGGGILLQDFVGPPVTTYAISNSTISGNTTSQNGGGVYANVNPGGGSVTIASSTITNNASTSGNTNIGDGVHDSLGAVEVQDTIIANNGDRDCTALGIADNGNNIGSDGTCGFTTDNTDPLLGTLSDNGGFTETHALLTGSPAIDNGSGACPATDQRTFGRVACDIGAFEGTIQPPAEISITIDETTLFEAGGVTVATITVEVDNTASTSAVGVILPLTVTGSATGVSTDYTLNIQQGIGTASVGQVNNIVATVGAGNIFTDTFTVTVVDDGFVENNELVTIVAGVIGYATIVSSDTLNITIVSDDVNPSSNDDDDDDGDPVEVAAVDDTPAESTVDETVLETVELLPSTGETPWWRTWVLAGAGVGIVGLIILGFGLRTRLLTQPEN